MFPEAALYTVSFPIKNLHFGSAPTLTGWEILELRELSEPDVSTITTYQSLKPHLTNTRQHLCLTFKTSLQSRSNFGERVLSIFLAKIMTAIFSWQRKAGERKKFVTKALNGSKKLRRGFGE